MFRNHSHHSLDHSRLGRGNDPRTHGGDTSVQPWWTPECPHGPRPSCPPMHVTCIIRTVGFPSSPGQNIIVHSTSSSTSSSSYVLFLLQSHQPSGLFILFPVLVRLTHSFLHTVDLSLDRRRTTERPTKSHISTYTRSNRRTRCVSNLPELMPPSCSSPEEHLERPSETPQTQPYQMTILASRTRLSYPPSCQHRPQHFLQHCL